MKKFSILVTSAGTASAVSVIKSLRKQSDISVKIVSIDKDWMAPGLYLSDRHYVSPKSSDPEYIKFIINLCLQEKINAIFPIHSSDISVYSKNKAVFRKGGIGILVSDPNTIDVCNNKRKMSRLCQKLNINSPKEYYIEDINNENFDKYPLFIKPAEGSSSSKGAYKIISKDEIKHHLIDDKLLIQEYIEYLFLPLFMYTQYLPQRSFL